MKPSGWCIVSLVAAAMGLFFSTVSAYDSVTHLDRQVHGVHCSYLLGLGATDTSGSSGCYATLMSPYSSILRKAIWGGIPIALPSMAVFGFILFWAAWLFLSNRLRDPRATGLLAAATGLTLLSSIIMGTISVVTLGTACKLCIGIYVASALGFGAALTLFIVARRASNDSQRIDKAPTLHSAPKLSLRAIALACGGGVLFVALPCGVYAAIAPDYSRYVGTCGSLRAPSDPHRVLVHLDGNKGGTNVVEVLDPLCGACKALERRFSAMSELKGVKRQVLLFPLDKKCNWMVDESVHPGACTASEAILCAGGQAREVLDWIFDHQQELLDAAKTNPEATRQRLLGAFPRLRSCVGTPAVRGRLNRALRFAVQNQLQVLTPQLFVEGTRLCDEDSDLGLEYAFSRMLERAKAAPEPPTPETKASGEQP